MFVLTLSSNGGAYDWSYLDLGFRIVKYGSKSQVVRISQLNIQLIVAVFNMRVSGVVRSESHLLLHRVILHIYEIPSAELK